MGAGRKLRLHRRDQRWADKDYKKSHLGNEWKKPFAGASHAKGIVLEKMCVPQQHFLAEQQQQERQQQQQQGWGQAGAYLGAALQSRGLPAWGAACLWLESLQGICTHW